MDILEELVMEYLVQNRKMFVAPQYRIGGGWSMPDFVALDFAAKLVFVVEVTANGWPGGLLRKVRDRENQWLAKLRSELRGARIADDSWKFRVELYIRKSAVERFQREIGDPPDVTVKSLEELGFYWQWDWSAEKAKKEAEEAG